MAWEWVGPVATATVGVVGVAGTYWTARLGRNAAIEQAREQRTHEREERSRTEKRTAYAAYLEAVTSGSRVISLVRRMTSTAEGRAEAREMRAQVLTDLALRRTQLRMVAPPRVRDIARRNHQYLMEGLNEAVSGRVPHHDTTYDAALLAVIKEDLGEPLAPEDWAAIDRMDQIIADSARTEDDE